MTFEPFLADDCKLFSHNSLEGFFFFCGLLTLCLFVCVGGGAQDGYTTHWTCHAHQKRTYLLLYKAYLGPSGIRDAENVDGNDIIL